MAGRLVQPLCQLCERAVAALHRCQGQQPCFHFFPGRNLTGLRLVFREAFFHYRNQGRIFASRIMTDYSLLEFSSQLQFFLVRAVKESGVLLSDHAANWNFVG